MMQLIVFISLILMLIIKESQILVLKAQKLTPFVSPY